MKIYDSLEAIPSRPGRVVTLGVFDGVHLGHQAVIEKLVEGARERHMPSLVLTFPNHPDEFLKQMEVPLLMDIKDRLDALRSLQVEEVACVPFDGAFSTIEAETFIKEFFVDRCGARHLVLGYDCHYGRGGKGDGHLAASLASSLNFTAEIVPPALFHNIPISSTLIRKVLQAGEVETAASLLGRRYSISGVVLQGDGRGATLGFPTANLNPKHILLPARGVYGAEVMLGQKTYKALVNIGNRPTFKKPTVELLVEAHLLDYQGNLYGREIVLSFCFRLRDEQRFESLEALKKQIQKDKKTALQKFDAICSDNP